MLLLEIEVIEAVEARDLSPDIAVPQEAPKPIAEAAIVAAIIDVVEPPIEAQDTAVEHAVHAVTNHQHVLHHVQVVIADLEAVEPVLEVLDIEVQDAAAHEVAEALDLAEVQEVLAEA